MVHDMPVNRDRRTNRRRWLGLGFVAIATLGAGNDTEPPDELTIARRVWTIGVEAGAADQEFGAIIDATWDSVGSVYLLDAAASVVRVFSPEGRSVRVFSRVGRGPGELSAARAIRHDGHSTLFVLDGVNGLALFRTTPQATTYIRTIKMPIALAQDFCLLGSRIFLYAPTADGSLLHEMAPDGRLIRSFGELFGPRAYPPMARVTMSGSGRLSCHPRAGMVVATARDGADIRAYAATDGRVAWRDSLRGFEPPVLEFTGTNANGNPTLRRSFSRGANHSNVVLRPLGDDVVIAQASRIHPSEDRIDTWLLDVRTGRQTYRTDQLKRLPAATPTRGLLLQERPYSTVSLVELKYVAR